MRGGSRRFDFYRTQLHWEKKAAGISITVLRLILLFFSGGTLQAQSVQGIHCALERHIPDTAAPTFQGNAESSSLPLPPCTLDSNSVTPLADGESQPLSVPPSQGLGDKSPNAGCATPSDRDQKMAATAASVPCNSRDGNAPRESSKASSAALMPYHERTDINRDIYYRNRLDLALDVGWHPVNIPFIYDFAVGDSYNMTPLKYTLVPIIASLRWQVTNVGWPSFLRGNMDFTFSGSITAIPRGPETHYYAFMFGIRRNFVHPNWKAVPFFEQRGGAGMINAKEPLGVLFAQGQNLTFTYNMGAGVRYSFNSKYSFSAGMNYMHISNGYLSQPQFTNYGINVYGPMFGFDMRLGRPHHASQ